MHSLDAPIRFTPLRHKKEKKKSINSPDSVCLTRVQGLIRITSSCVCSSVAGEESKFRYAVNANVVSKARRFKEVKSKCWYYSFIK